MVCTLVMGAAGAGWRLARDYGADEDKLQGRCRDFTAAAPLPLLLRPQR